jgi:hypothetical protein
MYDVELVLEILRQIHEAGKAPKVRGILSLIIISIWTPRRCTVYVKTTCHP